MLHRLFCQHRDLSDLRRADQENSTSLGVPARLFQVSEEEPSLTYSSASVVCVTGTRVMLHPQLLTQ